MAQVSLTEWNDFLDSHPQAHLLQTGEWGELKSSFGWKPVRLILDHGIGVQILFRSLPFGLTLGYMPKPALGDQRSAINQRFWRELDSVCQQHKAIFLKIEPDLGDDQPLITDSKLRISAHNIQPARTVLMAINGDEKDILARMKQKCRYNIRLAEKKGVTVRPWDDIAGFHAMVQVTGGRDGFGVHSQDYYQRAYELFHPKGMCEMLMAECEGQPLASLMVFANGNRAWYLYGASNDQERNRMPTYLLQWEAIRWAKARGCEEYDLWGVPDENEETLEANFETRSDDLWGVYRFKRGFGGDVERAAQAVDRVYNPLLYKLYLWRMAGREAG